jgi:hypothetical protein
MLDEVGMSFAGDYQVRSRVKQRSDLASLPFATKGVSKGSLKDFETLEPIS